MITTSFRTRTHIFSLNLLPHLIHRQFSSTYTVDEVYNMQNHSSFPLTLTILAYAIAENISNEDINLVAAALTQLGDTATIAILRDKDSDQNTNTDTIIETL